jgi:hypothetical protein
VDDRRAGLAGTFLAVTGAVLVWDLEHPGRFFYVLTRPQWRSWLVRGAVILTGYAAVLAVHVVAGLLGADGVLMPLAVVGIPLAVLTAVYTAFLFAQAKARDLWQNPLLPPHLVVQAAQAGAALAVPFAMWLEPELVLPLAWIVAATSAAHLLMVLGELTLPHPTAHARTAAHELTSGRCGPSSGPASRCRCWRWRRHSPRSWRCRRPSSRWPGCCCSSMPTSRPVSRCRSPERPSHPRSP